MLRLRLPSTFFHQPQSPGKSEQAKHPGYPQHPKRRNDERNERKYIAFQVEPFVWRDEELQEKIKNEDDPYDNAEGFQQGAELINELYDQQAEPDESKDYQGHLEEVFESL
jgi:hypothetical protein